MALHVLLCLFSAALTACLCTLLVRKGARQWNILDVPNQRSSHKKPTPTLGGIGIVAGVWCGLWILFLSGRNLEVGYAGLAWISVIILGAIIDDLIRPMKVVEKVMLQLAVISACIYFGFTFDQITLPYMGSIEIGGGKWIVSAIWLFSIANIFNFMDGIDGIIGFETIAVCLLVLLVLGSVDHDTAVLALVLVGGMSGFLVFNLSPASIFMGDVGSLFTGTMLGIMGILLENSGIPLWLFSMYLSYYLFDTLYTLVRRALNGENITVAHRKHLYQRLNLLGWSHLRVDLWIVLITGLCGIGGILVWRGAAILGGILSGGGGMLLLGTAVWIERSKPGFWKK